MPAAQRMDCPVHVTPREAEVLDLLAMGFGDAEIGETMGLATRTVKGYIGGLAEKLQVNSDKTGHRVLLARYWQYPIFRIGAGFDDGRNDHP
jgi:DNA-binding NarL/FixJ family response regulator